MSIDVIETGESIAFADLRDKAWPYSFTARIRVDELVGGTPSDPKVAEGWIKTKLGGKPEDEIQRIVAQIQTERGVSEEDAIAIANEYKNLNGFKRDRNGLYIEGRQAKAMLKEAANCAVAVKKIERLGWGATKKALLGFLAEHVFVPEKRIYLGKTEADRVQQRFVSTWRGTGIQYEEVCDKVVLDFTVLADYEFKYEDWAAIWLTAEKQGIGASRSQGYGTFTVLSWEPLS